MLAAEEKPEGQKYISLQEAAQYSEIYSQEYLSLRARQGKLKAIKFGRNWVTTKEWVDKYVHAENPEEYEYISLQEAAQYSNIYSQEYLSLRARQGRMRAVKFGRNWVTTKEWVDEYVYAENNVKLNIVNGNGNGKAAQKSIKQEIPVFNLKPHEEVELPSSVSQKNVFQFLFSPKFKVATTFLLITFVLAGSVFGYPFIKSNFSELPQKISKSLISFSRNAAKEGNFVLKNLTSNTGGTIKNFEKGIGGIKNFSDGLVLNLAKETFFSAKDLKSRLQRFAKNSFTDTAEIFSQNTNAILIFSQSAVGRFVNSSEKTKKFVLQLYENPRHYAFKFWQRILGFQKTTSDYFAGLPLFIKDSSKGHLKSQWQKIKISFANSKVFVAEIEQGISISAGVFKQSFNQTIQEQSKEVARKSSCGFDGIISVIQKAGRLSKVLVLNLIGNVKKGARFIARPWLENKQEFLVQEKIETPLAEKETKETAVKETQKVTEVSKIIKIEPVKEITKETVVSKIDSEELAILKSQIAELQKLSQKVQYYSPSNNVATSPVYIGSSGLEISGTASLASLGVSGFAGIRDLGVGNTLTVGTNNLFNVDKDGQMKSSSVTTGGVSASSISASGGITAGGDLAVSGTSILATTTVSYLYTTGNADIGGNLTVGGLAVFSTSTAVASTTVTKLSIGTTTVSNLFTVAGSGNIVFQNTGEVYIVPSGTTTIGASTSTPTVLSGYIASDVLPYYDNVYKIGSASYRWQKGYFGDSLYVGTSTSPALFVDGINNKVGISTTTPAALLNVYGSSTLAVYPLLRISTSTIEALFVDTAGNVGVGTTTVLYKFYVNGDSYFAGNSSTTGSQYIAGNLSIGGAYNITGTSTQATTSITQLLVSDNSILSGGLWVSGTSSLATTTITNLGITGNGNVLGNWIVSSTSTLATTTITNLQALYFNVLGTTNLGTTTLATTAVSNLQATNLNVLSTTSLAYLTVSNNLLASDDLTVTVTTTLNGDVVLGDTSADNIIINGTIATLTAATGSFADLSATGDLTVSATTTLNGPIVLGDNVSDTILITGTMSTGTFAYDVNILTGDLTVGATTTLNGDVVLGSASTDNITVNGRLATTTLASGVILGGDISGVLDFTASGTTTLATTSATLLTISGNGTVAGYFGIGTTTPYYPLTVSGDSYFAGNSTTTGSSYIATNLQVVGFQTIGSTLNVAGITSLGTTTLATTTVSNLQATYFNVLGTTTFAGDVTLGDADSDNILITGTPTFTPTSTFSSGVSVGGNLTASMDLTITATTTLNGDVVLGSDLNDNIAINGRVGTTTFIGGITVGGDLVADLDFSASGTSTLATTSATLLTISGNGTVAGYLGIGTTTPASKLEVLDSSNFQLRLSQGDGKYTDFRTNSGGSLTISPSSEYIYLTHTLPVTDSMYDLGGSLSRWAKGWFADIDSLQATIGTLYVSTTTISSTLTVQATSTLATTSISHLVVSGDSVLGNNSSSRLVVNGAVASNFVPDENATRDLGSSALYWNYLYINHVVANNLSSASTTIGGVNSESFTINSDNATEDTESQRLIFFRGTVEPNAVLTWDASADKFDLNQPIFIQNDSPTTTVVSFDVWGKSGQTADVLRIASSTGDVLFDVASLGNVGIGTSTSEHKLTVAGSGYITGNLNVAGDITIGGVYNISSTSTQSTTSVSQLLVSGNSILSGGLWVSGTSTLLGDVSVSNNLLASDDLTVTATTTLNGDVVLGNASTDNITVNGRLATTTLASGVILGGDISGVLDFTASGTTTLATTSATLLTISGNGTVAGYLGIGTTTPYTNLDVLGNIRATAFYGSATNLTNIPATTTFNSITVSGTLDVTGTSTLATTTATNLQALYFNVLGTTNLGTTTLATTAVSNLQATNLNVLSTTSLAYLTVSNNLLASDDLTVTATTTLNGDVVLGNASTDNITVNGRIAAMTVTGLSALGTTTMATSTATNLQALYFNVLGTTTFAGDVTLGNAAADKILITGAPTITPTTTFSAGATFAGDVTASTDLTIAATTTLNGDVVLGNASTDNITVNGRLATTTLASGVILGGDISGVLDFTASGTTTLATTSATLLTVSGNGTVAGYLGIGTTTPY
ncbi:MAG: hypothetical protein PHW31_03050, partial [Candidatus Pacebacteria bacterium]|nr:hypothetical protein [Candidatus Paceibacterota bacterium]